MRALPNHMRGFTLIETILYLGLLSILFSLLFVSIYPLITLSIRAGEHAILESERLFIFEKISYALGSVSDTSWTIASPGEGESTNELLILKDGASRFHFFLDTSNVHCSPPRVCPTLMLGEDGGDAYPLHTLRVAVTEFTVTHEAPAAGVPRVLRVSLGLDGKNRSPLLLTVPF